jgi:hypothetical protein
MASVNRKNDTLRWDPLSRVSANIARQNTPNAVTSVWTARELNMYPVVSKSCDVMSPFILTYSQLHTAAQEDFLAAILGFPSHAYGNIIAYVILFMRDFQCPDVPVYWSTSIIIIEIL